MIIQGNSTSFNQNPCSYLQNGISQDLYGFQGSITKGVYNAPFDWMNIVPPPISTDCVAPAQECTPNVPLTLSSASTFVSNGTIDIQCTLVTSGTNYEVQNLVYSTQTGFETLIVAGQLKYLGDIFPTILFPSGMEFFIYFTLSDATTAIADFTIVGYDMYRKPVSEVIQIPVGTTFFTSLKGYNQIISITPNADPGVSVMVGTNENTPLGLNFLINNIESVLAVQFDGSTRPVFSGNTWRRAMPNSNYVVWPGSSPTYTVSTRGCVVPEVAPNGLDALSVYYYAYGADAQLSTQVQNQQQSALTIIQCAVVNNDYFLPNMNVYDLSGVQYPGDLPWIIQYNNALIGASTL